MDSAFWKIMNRWTQFRKKIIVDVFLEKEE